jgi:hypothetical protein
MVLSSVDKEAREVAGAVHHDGAVSVVWLETIDEESSMLLARKRSSDGAWGEPREVGPTPDIGTSVNGFQLASNDWGDLVASWSTGYEHVAAVYDVVTDDWTEIAPLPFEHGSNAGWTMAVDAYGTAIIVVDAPELQATRNTAADRTWSAPITLSPARSRPTVTTDHFGRVMVGWQDDVTVAVIENRAGVWYAPHQLSAAGPTAITSYPLVRLAASDTGDFAALWTFGAELLLSATYDGQTGEWSSPSAVPHPDPDVRFEQPTTGALRSDGKQLWVVESEDPFTFATLQFTPAASLADAGAEEAGRWESEWISDLGGDYRDEVSMIGPCLHGAMTRVDYGGIYDLGGTVTLGDGENLYWPPAEPFEALEGYTYLPHPLVDSLGRTTLVWLQADSRQEETGLPNRVHVMDWR